MYPHRCFIDWRNFEPPWQICDRGPITHLLGNGSVFGRNPLPFRHNGFLLNGDPAHWLRRNAAKEAPPALPPMVMGVASGFTAGGSRAGFAETYVSPIKEEARIERAAEADHRGTSSDGYTPDIYGLCQARFAPSIKDIRRIPTKNRPNPPHKSFPRHGSARAPEIQKAMGLPGGLGPAGAPNMTLRGRGAAENGAGRLPPRRTAPQHTDTPSRRLISRRQDARAGDVAARNVHSGHRRRGSFGSVPRRGGAVRASPPPTDARFGGA